MTPPADARLRENLLCGKCGRRVGMSREGAGLTILACPTCYRLDAIRERLYPDDPTYYAAPIDIADARLVLQLLDEALSQIVKAAVSSSQTWQPDWKPIATAPKTGIVILLFQPSGLGWVTAQWAELDISWWHVDDGKRGPFPLRGPTPTHWMPLPAPPASEPDK